MQIEETPKVSVIMPVYNGEQTLKYAIASLMRQTYENWICIIVNDGSTDNTRVILDSLSDPRFQIYHLEKNGGRGVARDEALKHVEGKYLAYLDADDMLHEDKLRVQVEFLESHPDIQMVGCGSITYASDFTPVSVINIRSIEDGEIYKYGRLLPLLPGAIMVRVDRAKKISYNHQLDVGEDYDYFSRYCDNEKYGNIALPYYYYQIGNVTAKKLISYQWKCMMTAIVLIQNKYIIEGVKRIFVRFFKLIIYLILVVILGANKIVLIRNSQFKLSSFQKDDFKDQINKIITQTNSHCFLSANK